MNVVHVNANDVSGGAARSCYRLHQFLLRQGVNSRLLVQHKRSIDPTVELIEPWVTDTGSFQNVELVQRVFAAHNRTDISNTHFSVSLAGPDLSRHPAVEAADVIHLHWVASMQTPANIRRLMALGKPVVWTLHDLRPLTGGCHFPAGCSKFQDLCASCPQLRYDPLDLPAAALREQIELIDVANLTIIAPSRWIAEQARLSAMLRDKTRIETIPNGIDADVFAPRSRVEAREALGLARDGIYILCGADHTEEKRKGFESLARVLGEVVHDPRFVSSGARLLWVGDQPASQAYGDMPLIPLGRIPQEEQMALAYAASDLFLLPSLEDNLPNMLLEALSCGTPAIAYSVGGIPEVLHDGVNGRLIPAADEPEFVQALLCLVGDASVREEMGRRARALASEAHSSSLQANRHVALYRDLIQKSRFTTSPRQSTSRHAHDSTDPDAAVGTLQKSLTIHCLTEEMRVLQRHVQAADSVCMIQNQVIENLQRQLDARLEVIRGLQDHLLRVEEACAARLEVIERQQKELDARSEVIEGLQGHLLRVEEACSARLEVIERQQQELDARSEVIEGLQDHWQRAEETCAARLGIIEKLEARSYADHVRRLLRGRN